MYTVIIGIVMLVVFMALVLSRRVSPLTALVLVPILFGFIAGYGIDTFRYATRGMLSVGATVAMLTFAILFFGIMLCTGLFDPLAGIVIKFMKGDPFRVIVGTVILSTLVSLDGDGTTTVMICCTALLPVYNKLKINRAYLAIFVILLNGIINMLPWGGPTARLLAVLPLDSGQVLTALLPYMVSTLALTLVMAAYAGFSERKRLGIADLNFQAASVDISAEDLELRRPKMIWFNLVVSVLCMVAIIGIKIPGPLVFAVGSCIALAANYRKLKMQRRVIESSAEGIINVVVMILGAGVLMGMLNESGMSNEIATALVSVIPESWGKYFTAVIALISGPAVWILNNDAFYFGVFPVMAETASAYGFTDMQIGIASLAGQCLRGFSPVIPALYFLVAYVKIEFSDFQRKIIPFCLITFAFNLLFRVLLGVYTLP